MQRSDQPRSRQRRLVRRTDISGLSFEDDGKDDLSGLDLVYDIGILQAGVPAMNILEALADLQLGGKDKDGEIDLKAKACLDAKVGRAELYQVFRLAG